MGYDWMFMATCVIVPLIGTVLAYPFIRRKYPD